MAAAKPAKASTGLIDPTQHGNYPITLGESLKGSSKSDRDNLLLRYNWIPRAGLAHQSGNLIQSENSFKLTYNHDQDAYSYSGWNSAQESSREDRDSPTLVLVHDTENQAFRLEKITATLDLNLDSATGKSDEQISKLPRIAHHTQSLQLGASKSVDDDDVDQNESADPNNPFDFRHFLSEAKDTVEKSIHGTGARTPIPGGRTPLNKGSPVAGHGRFASPQFKPTPVISNKKAELPRKKMPATTAGRKLSSTKSKAQTETKPQSLSKERISDSDEEMEDVPVLPAQPRRESGHQRSISSNSNNKPPRIIADGGLEIDMGSPPMEARRRNRIDPEAFRSQTGTPIFGFSSNRRHRASPSLRDIEMEDSGHDEEDEYPGLVEDDDVEAIDLGSPREQNTPEARRTSNHALTPPRYKPRSPSPVRPAPSTQHAAEEDDDDLAGLLEAALEEADDDEGNGVGLGIQTAPEDESEVSEEE